METQKASNIFSIVLSSLTILSAVSVFLGHMCTNMIGSGFFAYLLNIFSAPILMIFPVFVSIFGGLWVVYIIVSIFLVVGIINLIVSIKLVKDENFNYSCFVTNFICSCIAIFLAALIFYSLIANGFKILSDSSIWSIFWLILFLIGIIWSFVLKIILMVRYNKNTEIVVK